MSIYIANIPPHIKISDFVQKAKGRSSKRIEEEFPILKKKYCGRHLWGRGYFSSISVNVTDDMINEYINNHTDAMRPTILLKY
jgi:putative transposase